MPHGSTLNLRSEIFWKILLVTIHSYNTRRKYYLKINHSRTTHGRPGLNAADLFAGLSDEIKNLNNLKMFIKAIADHLAHGETMKGH